MQQQDVKGTKISESRAMRANSLLPALLIKKMAIEKQREEERLRAEKGRFIRSTYKSRMAFHKLHTFV